VTDFFPSAEEIAARLRVAEAEPERRQAVIAIAKEFLAKAEAAGATPAQAGGWHAQLIYYLHPGPPPQWRWDEPEPGRAYHYKLTSSPLDKPPPDIRPEDLRENLLRELGF
jgi:hypothetical protein